MEIHLKTSKLQRWAQRHKAHRFNKRFYVFYSGHVFYVFKVFVFPRFFILSNVKYEYAKIQRETLLEEASAMIFLLILVCYVYSPYCKNILLTCWRALIHTDNNWIDGKFWQSFFIKRLQTFIFIFYVFKFSTFFYFYLNVYYNYDKAWEGDSDQVSFAEKIIQNDVLTSWLSSWPWPWPWPWLFSRTCVQRQLVPRKYHVLDFVSCMTYRKLFWTIDNYGTPLTTER